MTTATEVTDQVAEPTGTASGRATAHPDSPELAAAPRGLPIGWWGMFWLIVTEAMLFGGLLSAWFFIRAVSPAWPQGDIPAPELGLSSVFTVVLLSSSLPVVWAELAVSRGRMAAVRLGLALSWLLGAAFLAHQIYEYDQTWREFRIEDNAYASLFYVITGLHGLHVLVGLVMSLVVQLKAGTGRLGPDHHLTLKIFAMYWHFVDVVWIAVFSSLYLSTHIS